MTLESPILVTGAHRSGTTWVGKTMAVSRHVRYVDEPFNVHVHGNENLLGHPFAHITRANESRFKKFKVLLSMACYADGNGERPLIKDPIAFFSAPWIDARYKAKVIVLVRHPAAFAASLNRLGWGFDFNHLLAQKGLMRDRLDPFAEEISDYARSPRPILEQAALLWKCIYSVARSYENEHPDWLIKRHEDICLDPLKEFSEMFGHAGLPLSDSAAGLIRETSDPANPTDAPKGVAHQMMRSSKKIVGRFKKHLTPGEISRIREISGEWADHYYADEDWN